MHNQPQHAPVLVFTCGNPSRGDDALGPAMFDLLERDKHETGNMNHVDLLTDFQLQIEHAIDFEQREGIIFIDASVSCQPPHEFHPLQPAQDDSYTTHSMSPAAVLAVYEKINQRNIPPSYLLTIRGYDYGLGTDMSAQANNNLQQAYSFVKTLLENNVEKWKEMHVI